MKPTLVTTYPEGANQSAGDDVDLAALPKRVDRRAGAEILTRHFFPVSPRTIEAWPLMVRRVNGRALYETADLVAFARAKVTEAPAIRGGRRSGNAAA